MPKMEIQIHPLAVERLRGCHADTQTKDRGTGRTDAIILHGLVTLQKQGYLDDSRVWLKDHYEGTSVNLRRFADRAQDIVKILRYENHVEVTVCYVNKVVILGWRNV